ncbi:hypothetical protein [Chryseobacterium oryctis]|uniref:Lysozyme inhibitor LprI N-terminal domain-containing protein n=1 Tax=Chryseobacterium oryctis TaxID=2952618 RepID=A0ABT3HKH5_9FLAO|nr:hypothetical protein [Chryseobacterium oryctis]MCW3160290.1 hypothetical protein [Chryseobacterium oryctis]
MRTLILLFSLIIILSCKKETQSQEKNSKDSLAVSEIAKDSIKNEEVKQETFSFVTELCDNKGYFDANKYSKEELEGTYKLWFTMSGTLLDTPSVFNLKDLQEVRTEKDKILAKLDKDFSEKKRMIESLNVVKDTYWQNVKAQKLQELNDEYEFRKTQIQAFTDPSILLNHKLSKGCENFAKALNSDESQMFAEWRKLREAMSKKNGNPERIMNEFEEHLNSPDKRDYAIADLLTFGWGNCVNAHLRKVEHDEEMYNRFNSLFIKIDSECDEP